jgi:hypothetical protein
VRHVGGQQALRLGDGGLDILASMLRASVNCTVICVVPWVFWELMLCTPAMVENWRSRGVATEAAMVSGLAPGSSAFTWIFG